MDKLKKIYEKITDITDEIGNSHVGAYAAQSAYFFMLCMIPIILLLLTLVQYTPVTKADVMTAVMQVFPSSVESMMATVVNQVYNQSMGIIPVTIIVALWSAGKGVLAMTTGLNCVYHCKETRNYVILRLRSTLYTLMFLLVHAGLTEHGVANNGSVTPYSKFNYYAVEKGTDDSNVRIRINGTRRELVLLFPKEQLGLFEAYMVKNEIPVLEAYRSSQKKKN